MGSIMSRLFMTNANVAFALIAFSAFTAIAARFFFFFFFFLIVILTSIITNTMLATLIYTSV
jgi:hypothetical protein